MKKLFGSVSYSFDNFYNNLNMQGQIIFAIIMALIVVLCIILFISYIIENLQSKAKFFKLKKENKKIIKENKKIIKENNKKEEKVVKEEDNEIKDIASSINDAIKNQSPINLTNFEEDQEKTAIISIDELYQKAKELELIEDEETGVNYLEKYNLEPAEITKEEKEIKEENKVKAFKVSQVISPIYGVKKEAVDNE